MNNIVFAGKPAEAAALRTGARFTVITDGETATAIPPSVKYGLLGGEGKLCVLIERALLPFREITVVKDDENRGILQAAMQAEAYFRGENAQCGTDKKDLILSALGGLIVAYFTAFAANGDFSPVTRQILNDIEKNLSNTTFFLEDYIKTLPLNYDYVRKVFKKEVGATPHEYLLRKRMELAANLLSSGMSNRYSAYSVSQIAEACGFADPLYFSKVFKKYYGVAPGGYCKTAPDGYGKKQ